MARLDDDALRAALADLPGWEDGGGSIVRELRFPTFRDSVAFVVRLSYEAEAANHHPDLDIRYNRVRIALRTHDQGGVTEKDIDLAGTIQSLAASA